MLLEIKDSLLDKQVFKGCCQNVNGISHGAIARRQFKKQAKMQQGNLDAEARAVT